MTLGPIDLVRSVISLPPMSLPADELEAATRAVERRAVRARAMGGAYRRIALSRHVRDLLDRLDAGATIAGDTVH